MVFLDMDGVICDFVGGVRKLFDALGTPMPPEAEWPGGDYDIEKKLGVSRNFFWGAIDKAGEDWWESLEPYPWIGELIELAGPGFVIATSPALAPSCHAGKVRWMRRHLGSGFRSYFLCASGKEALAAPGRILVEDNDRNAAAFTRAGGHSALIPQPWNSGYALLADPAVDRLAAVREALK